MSSSTAMTIFGHSEEMAIELCSARQTVRGEVRVVPMSCMRITHRRREPPQ